MERLDEEEDNHIRICALKLILRDLRSNLSSLKQSSSKKLNTNKF